MDQQVPQHPDEHQQLHPNIQYVHVRPEDARIQKTEMTFTLKEALPILIFAGAIVSSWVNLNSSQVETDTKLQAFEKYYRESFKTYKTNSDKARTDLKNLIEANSDAAADIKEQVNSIEQTVTLMYQRSVKKR